jgi:hypothetical protein
VDIHGESDEKSRRRLRINDSSQLMKIDLSVVDRYKQLLHVNNSPQAVDAPDDQYDICYKNRR